MDSLKEKLLELLRQKSPRSTYNLASSLNASWHSVHEKLLELQVEGIVERLVVSGMNLWFLKEHRIFNNSLTQKVMMDEE